MVETKSPRIEMRLEAMMIEKSGKWMNDLSMSDLMGVSNGMFLCPQKLGLIFTPLLHDQPFWIFILGTLFSFSLRD